MTTALLRVTERSDSICSKELKAAATGHNSQSANPAKQSQDVWLPKPGVRDGSPGTRAHQHPGSLRGS